MTRLVYRDNMTPEECAAFKQQLDAEDAAFANAADMNPPQPMTEDEIEEAAAAEEQTLDYFNRYIAGDR